MKKIIYLMVVVLSVSFIGCTANKIEGETTKVGTETSNNSFDGGLLKNGDFSEGIETAATKGNWYFYLNAGGEGEHEITDGVLGVVSTNPAAEAYGVQLIQGGVNLEELGLYKITFSAKAEKERNLKLKIGAGSDRGWATYYEENVTLTTEMKDYEIEFKMKEKVNPNSRVEFWFTEDTAKVWLDEISLIKTGIAEPSGVSTIYPGTNAIKNGNFITGESKWTAYVDETAKGEIIFEKAQAKVMIEDEGPENWSIHLEQGDFTLESNKEYTISFDAMSNIPREIELIIENKKDFRKYLAGRIPLTDEMQTYGATFKMEGETDPDVHLVIAMGKMDDKLGQNHEIVIDNVSMEREIGELVWSDEFDYEGLPDSKKWDYVVGGKLFNNEYQYYTDADIDNVFVKEGKLTIKAIKEDYKNCEYTSARITSSGKGEMLYGRVEVRAKLPGGSGTWPAIWMYPTDEAYGAWPASGEIDIMEFVGNDPKHVHASTHCLNYNFMNKNNFTEKMDVEGLDANFHVYSMEWLPGQLDMYFDNKLYFSIKDEEEGWEKWPYDQRFHMIMNLAVGGDWGAASGFNPDTWPQTLEVDYVRMYDLNVDLSNDTEEPLAPENLSGEANGYMISLEWEPSADNLGIDKYEIYMNDEKIVETKKNAYIIGDLKEETEYSFKIRALDYAENKSGYTEATVMTKKLEPKMIPGKIKAAEFDLMSGVQTQETEDTDGGENVGWIDNNDWMEYLIEVPESRNYKLEYRVASAPGGAIMELRDNKDNVYTSTELPLTEGWQDWQTVESEEVYLEKGVQVIRAYAKKGGFNLNWIEVK